MSASKEKKARQEQAASGWTDPKTAREAQKRKEEKRSNILYATIAILFVVVAAATFVWKSGIVQRSATAATVNGETYTAGEVQYYYTTTYQNFLSQYGYYASMLGLDTSSSLKNQECAIDEESETWYDYFVKQALQQMADIHAVYDKAIADGFAWNDDMQADFDDTMESLQGSVDTYNHAYASNLKTEDYLQLVYGSTMTQKIYEEQLKVSILAQAYSDSFVSSLEYSDSELEAAYSEDKNSYDLVNYECVRVNGAAESTTDANGNTVDPTDDEKAAALRAAKDLADSIYASYQAGESLEDLADGEDKASYTEGENASYYDSTLLNWLFASGRKDGDSTVLADEDNSAYYVVVFGQRFRPEFDVQDVRHILISPEDGEKSEGDEGYEEEQAQLMADAKAKAEDLLAQYLAGDATEDAFAALAAEYSEDTGSASNGGLISQVSELSNYVENFQNWCLASHKPGDTGIVESVYGYHIMYFAGNEEAYWKAQVRSNLTSNAYMEWYGETTKDTSYEQSSGIRYVG